MKQSVLVFGWATIIASAILILSQVLNLAITGSVDQVAGLFGGYSGLKSTTLGPVMDMLTYNRIWSMYSVVYFACTFAGGIQFVRFHESGRKILEIACWIGFLNACVDTTMSYIFWKSMESAMDAVAGGLGLTVGQLGPFGLGAIVVGFFIWVIPSIGIIIYLRRPSVKALMVTSRLGGSREEPQNTSATKHKHANPLGQYGSER